MPRSPPIAIEGVWCRKLGSGTDQRIEVLVEVDGKWRLIQTHRGLTLDGELSHITEPGGIADAPEDTLR
jgi:hypothetical protein